MQGPRLGDRSQVSERFAKSRSVMIENLHFNAPPINIGPPPPKSATLPPNFATPNNEDLVSFAHNVSDVVFSLFSFTHNPTSVEVLSYSEH